MGQESVWGENGMKESVWGERESVWDDSVGARERGRVHRVRVGQERVCGQWELDERDFVCDESEAREKMCVWFENGARERMCELRVVQESVWGVRGCVG